MRDRFGLPPMNASLSPKEMNMEECNGSNPIRSKAIGRSVAPNPIVDGASGGGLKDVLRNPARAFALLVGLGFAALPTARADEPAPPPKPAISDEAAAAV